MINVTSWIHSFQIKLNEVFDKRVWFLGLQGSYGRGEATETSDLDMVVILDELSAADIETYDAMLNTLPHRELVCGFLAGKNELLNWEPSDLFQFCYDTAPIQGSLDEVLSLVDEEAVCRAIKIGVCNLYHGCVHNMLHEKSDDILCGLYKSASFVIQAIVFKQTGSYIKQQKELQRLASPDEKAIADTFVYLKSGGKVDFGKMSETLFIWCKKQLFKDT